MKKAISIMLVVLMVFGLAACNGKKDPDPETKETIKIAVIDAFTGDKAVNGQYSKEGIELALAEINEKGVLGRQVELIYEDGQGKETETTNAYQKVTAEHKLDAVILDKYSSDVLAVEQFVAENGLPTFCQGSSIKIEGSSTKNLYSTRRSDAGAGGSVVAFIKEQGVKKVAILHSPDALGQSMGKVVVDGLAKIGVEVVSDQQFANEDQNFTNYIAKVLASGCDCFVAIAQTSHSAQIMIAAQEAGLSQGDNAILCIGNSAFVQQSSIQNALEASNNWYACTAFSPTISLEPTASWIKKYNDTYGRLPDMTSACMYDSLKMLAYAMEQAGSTDPEKVNAAIQAITDFKGVVASYGYQGNPMMSKAEYVCHIEDQKSIVKQIVYAE